MMVKSVIKGLRDPSDFFDEMYAKLQEMNFATGHFGV